MISHFVLIKPILAQTSDEDDPKEHQHESKENASYEDNYESEYYSDEDHYVMESKSGQS